MPHPEPSDLFPPSAGRGLHRLGEADRGAAIVTSDGPIDPPWWSGEEDDRHYARLRAEHARRLDDEHHRRRRGPR